MNKRWIGRICLVLACVGNSALPVRADEAAEIRDAVAAINESLVRMKDELTGIGGDISTSSIDKLSRVRVSAQQVRDKASQLAGKSHDRWADIGDRLRDGAETTYSRWERAAEEAHRQCDELAKQRQHREVQSALTALAQNAGGREQLYREMDEHLERIAGLLKDLHERQGTAESEAALAPRRQARRRAQPAARCPGSRRPGSRNGQPLAELRRALPQGSAGAQ